ASARQLQIAIESFALEHGMALSMTRMADHVRQLMGPEASREPEEMGMPVEPAEFEDSAVISIPLLSSEALELVETTTGLTQQPQSTQIATEPEASTGVAIKPANDTAGVFFEPAAEPQQDATLCLRGPARPCSVGPAHDAFAPGASAGVGAARRSSNTI